VKLFDAHNHLQDDRLKNFRDKELKALAHDSSHQMVVNGTSPDDWCRVSQLAEDYPDLVLPSYGLHPWKVQGVVGDWFGQLEERVLSSSFKAVGECGLDRWIKPSRLEFEDQMQCFCLQLDLAAQQNLPITIHCLKATGALLAVLKQRVLPERGVLLHSFSLNREVLRELARYPVYFSVSPYFFHPRKVGVLEVFKEVDPARLLLETDAPDMAGPILHFQSFTDEESPHKPTSIETLYQLAERYFELPQQQFLQNSRNYFAT